jgi:hypothetical protein
MSASQLIPNLMTNNTPGIAKGIQANGMVPVGNAGGSNNPGPTAINGIATSVNPIMQGAVPGAPSATTSQFSTQQQTNSGKQLTDVFGKGVGGDINSVINNLGSNDSTYMQAYQNAMANPNAEASASLLTTLGNAGVSANSSTAAIGLADLGGQETSQEGLQEAQLQQTDEQNLIGLLQGTQGAANKEASTSVWGDIGSVLGAVGADAGAALGSTDLTKII